MTAHGGITDLDRLLASAAPELQPGEFVFVAVPDSATAAALDAIGTFREAEGVTAICARAKAEKTGLPFDGPFRQITIKVHSSLHAVGFLAAVARLLAGRQIPCNAISALHHDHLFVPADRAEGALQVLARLSRV